MEVKEEKTHSTENGVVLLKAEGSVHSNHIEDTEESRGWRRLTGQVAPWKCLSWEMEEEVLNKHDVEEAKREFSRKR